MTSLVAIVVVSIVTNVTSASNESGCKTCSAAGPGFVPAVYYSHGGLGNCLPYKPATEKTETTEVVERKVLTFMWEGKEYSTVSERVLESSVRKQVLRETWEEVP